MAQSSATLRLTMESSRNVTSINCASDTPRLGLLRLGLVCQTIFSLLHHRLPLFRRRTTRLAIRREPASHLIATHPRSILRGGGVGSRTVSPPYFLADTISPVHRVRPRGRRDVLLFFSPCSLPLTCIYIYRDDLPSGLSVCVCRALHDVCCFSPVSSGSLRVWSSFVLQ